MFLDSSEPLTVQCRFCGARWQTHSEVVADHFIENGCPWCQRRFNRTAERLLQQISDLRPLPPQEESPP